MEQPCGVHTAEIENLKKDDVAQWTAIDTLRTRLDELMRKWIPVWVAFLLMAMSGVTTAALTFAGMIIKFSNGRG